MPKFLFNAPIRGQGFEHMKNILFLSENNSLPGSSANKYQRYRKRIGSAVAVPWHRWIVSIARKLYHALIRTLNIKYRNLSRWLISKACERQKYFHCMIETLSSQKSMRKTLIHNDDENEFCYENLYPRHSLPIFSRRAKIFEDKIAVPRRSEEMKSETYLVRPLGKFGKAYILDKFAYKQYKTTLAIAFNAILILGAVPFIWPLVMGHAFPVFYYVGFNAIVIVTILAALRTILSGNQQSGNSKNHIIVDDSDSWNPPFRRYISFHRYFSLVAASILLFLSSIVSVSALYKGTKFDPIILVLVIPSILVWFYFFKTRQDT
jgi:hypothetical protein